MYVSRDITIYKSKVSAWNAVRHTLLSRVSVLFGLSLLPYQQAYQWVTGKQGVCLTAIKVMTQAACVCYYYSEQLAMQWRLDY